MKTYNLRKIAQHNKSLLLASLGIVIIFSIIPIFALTPEAAESRWKWITLLIGLVIASGPISLVMTYSGKKYASPGMIRVLFMNHTNLTMDIVDEFSSLDKARNEIHKKCEVNSIWGILLFYNDEGELLHRIDRRRQPTLC